MRVILATANPDKARELRELLGEVDGVVVLPRPEGLADVEETGATLQENAELKARFVADATGLPALADDTGLFVDALDGAPGVYSARFAGEDATYADNVAKLLVVLDGVPVPRTARFETVVVLAEPSGRCTATVGSVRGTIATTPRGRQGFGYDGLFVLDGGDGRTLAELSSDEKHAVSHRARALRAMAEHLRGATG